MSDVVSVCANGVDLKGWTDVSITAGITMAARSFSVGITFVWPQAKDVLTAVNLGDRVEVKIGSETVLTGYIFATPVNYDSNSVSVSIAGRSKTADIIDCCPIASAVIKTSLFSWFSLDKRRCGASCRIYTSSSNAFRGSMEK